MSSKTTAQSIEPQPVYLICGEEEYAVSEQTRKIVETLCPPADQDFGLERIDANVKTKDEAVLIIRNCMDALMTVGFLGTGKVVWLENASFLSEGLPGKTDEVKAELERLTALIKAGLPDGQHLVISAPKVSRRLSFYKACNKAGAVYTYEISAKTFQAEKDARNRIQELLRKYKLKMDKNTADAFLHKTGFDTRQMHQELEKLQLYHGEGASITRNDVQLMVSPSREAIVWELTEAVGLRNLRLALNALQNMFLHKQSPVGIIFALQSHFRKLAMMRDCMQRRWYTGTGRYGEEPWSGGAEEDEVLSQFGKEDPRKMHSFRAFKLSEQAGKYSVEQLAASRKKIIETHEKLVSSPVSQELLLELLIVEIIAQP